MNYFYAGGGLNLSNSGLFEFVNLTDAYFLPLVARQDLNSRQWDIQTAKNDALLLTADAYFRVHQHRGRYAAALYCVERGRELVDQVASLSKELVPIVEVDAPGTCSPTSSSKPPPNARRGAFTAPISPAYSA